MLLSRVVYVMQELYSPEAQSPDAPWCGIETTGPGLATFDFAMTLGVVNLFMAPRYDVVKGGVSYKKGWRTDTNSRNELIGGIRNYLIDRAGRLNSQRLVGELLSFVRSKTGKPQAKSGTHDDTVMSFGIALQIDEILPVDEVVKKEVPLERPEDRYVGSREGHEVDEPMTQEELCLQTALKARSLMEHTEIEEMRGGYYA